MELKNNPIRQIVGTYPLCFTARILYSDMDAFRHLNNGATGRYLEEGRSDLNMHVFGVESMINPPGALQLLFATVTLDYVRQAHYPGSIDVASGVRTTGGSSYVIAQAAFQNGECFALAEAVMVKAIAGKPAHLSDDEREAMKPLMLRF